MINKNNLKKLLKILEFTCKKNVYFYKSKEHGYTITVDFKGKGSIIYPKGIIVNDGTTSNFSHNENFVVLECVYTLLKQGYKEAQGKLFGRIATVIPLIPLFI